MTIADSTEHEFIPGYRVRLRFFTAGNIKSETPTVEFTVEGLSAKLTGVDENAPIDSKEIKMNVYGIEDEARARALAQKLATAVSLSSALRPFGVNLGENHPTTALSNVFRSELENRSGIKWRDNVHGVDIFDQDAPTVYFAPAMTAAVSMNGKHFVDGIQNVLAWVGSVPSELWGIAGMLNAADFSTSEITKIGISMSAIENMAPRLEWTDAQMAALDRVKDAIDAEALNNEELEPIARAVSDLRRGPSLGASLRALLGNLELSELWKELKVLRVRRGRLMHGSGLSRDELLDTSVRTRNLAQTIFKAALAKKGLPTIIDPPASTQ